MAEKVIICVGFETVEVVGELVGTTESHISILNPLKLVRDPLWEPNEVGEEILIGEACYLIDYLPYTKEDVVSISKSHLKMNPVSVTDEEILECYFTIVCEVRSEKLGEELKEEEPESRVISKEGNVARVDFRRQKA